MAAYLVAKRNGLSPRSETYLINYEPAHEGLNLHIVMRTVNAIETAIGTGAKHLWEQQDDGGVKMWLLKKPNQLKRLYFEKCPHVDTLQ